MQIPTLTLKSPLPPNGVSPSFENHQNSGLMIQAILSPTHFYNHKILKPRYQILKDCCNNGAKFIVPKYSYSVAQGERLRSVGVDKEFDVATLGNLCVDIVLNVPKLPPNSRDARKAYMDELSESPPDKVCCKLFFRGFFLKWELLELKVGVNGNIVCISSSKLHV